jgi:hypothetical protein
MSKQLEIAIEDRQAMWSIRAYWDAVASAAREQGAPHPDPEKAAAAMIKVHAAERAVAIARERKR